MSSYGYDEYGNPSQVEESQEGGGLKDLRNHLKEISGELKELRAENAALKQDQTRAQVTQQLQAKGYAPEAASLYQGEPTGVDDWLKTYGNALAKLPGAPGEEPGGPEGQQAPQGPPQSSVPADQQVQMQQMAQAGTQGVLPPQGTDKELAAQIAAAQTPEEFERIMRSQGNQLDWT